jgi:gliding motility-associated-like protein
MKKLVLIIIVYFLPFFSLNAQYIGNNLVPNPSFEDYTQCPDNCCQIVFAFPWKDCLYGNGSSDFYNTCSNASIILNLLSGQMPRTGNGEAGIYFFFNHNLNNNGREYIQVELKTDLHKDKTYCTDFYVSLANSAQYAIENIHAYFSVNEIIQSSINFFQFTPQIKNKNGIIKDTADWVRISESFIANGGEKNITIGNFDSTVNTNYIFVNYGVSHAYYYIDDVSVCECSFDINLGKDTSLCEGESLILNPMLPNASYTWQDSSHAATFEVKQPGTYWVRAFVAEYDITSTDTIVITAGEDSYCNPPLTIPNVITPNGDSQNDNFQIQNAETYDIALQIYNRWGVLIYETTNYQNNYNCNDCAAGVYYYVLKAKSKRNGREKEYKGSLTIING